MDALRQLRRFRRQAAGSDFGVSTWSQNVWSGQFKAMGADLDILALPLGSPTVALNFLGTGAMREDGAPAFGAARFMLGFSTPGGPDVLE